MDKRSNQQILEETYRNFAAGNMSAVLSSFDKDIIWERPGAPAIPFSGIFKGIDEVTRMFAIVASTINIKTFLPDRICSNDDTVVVLGHDLVEVIATGKAYSTNWAQAFTFKNGKIVYVQVYLDTKSIAEAFSP